MHLIRHMRRTPYESPAAPISKQKRTDQSVVIELSGLLFGLEMYVFRSENVQRQDYRVHTVLKSPCIFLKNP